MLNDDEPGGGLGAGEGGGAGGNREGGGGAMKHRLQSTFSFDVFFIFFPFFLNPFAVRVNELIHELMNEFISLNKRVTLC